MEAGGLGAFARPVQTFDHDERASARHLIMWMIKVLEKVSA